MTSFIAWVDYSSVERERMKQAVALFKESDTVDEMGLGSIRDIIANRLFPGTSTIQTRLRYFLFIPWIYRDLEISGRADRVETLGRKRELALTAPLVAAGDLRGVMGQDAGETLRRLPSSVYWNGLQSWGLFLKQWSQEEYRRNFPQIRARRANERHTDDRGILADGIPTWNPHLPPAPADFPEGISFSLSHDEADFLRGRVRNAHPTSLLAHWMSGESTARAELTEQTPWNAARALPADLEQELRVAQKFSILMHGAPRLYNVALAEQSNSPDADKWRAAHLAALEEWQKDAEDLGVLDWDLNELWWFCSQAGRAAPFQTRAFIEDWHRELRSAGLSSVANAASLRTLIRQREVRLKGARSRFRGGRPLELWGGSSGTNLMTYRWGTVQTFLTDLYAGLDRENS